MRSKPTFSLERKHSQPLRLTNSNPRHNQICSGAQDLVSGRGAAPASFLSLLQTLGVTRLAIRINWVRMPGAFLDDVVLVDGILLIALCGINCQRR